MSKEFKEYDAKYKYNTGKSFDSIQAFGGSIAREDYEPMKSWADFVGWDWVYIQSYSSDVVREAVYESITADHWQMFRVGMKGLTTQKKLYCLAWYWLNCNWGEDDALKKIRINNYLGALIRGGQLNDKLEILK